MLSKYFLILAIVLQINCSLSAPVDDGRIMNEQRQKRQTWNFNPPLSYNFKVPEQPRWSFGEQPKGIDSFRINPQYRVNDNFKFGPYIDYAPRQGFNGAGIRAEYRWKRSIDEDTQQQVN